MTAVQFVAAAVLRGPVSPPGLPGVDRPDLFNLPGRPTLKINWELAPAQMVGAAPGLWAKLTALMKSGVAR